MTSGALVPQKVFRPGAERRLRALDEIQRHVRDRLATYAPNTQRALKADWTVWYAWCVVSTPASLQLPTIISPC